MHACLLQSSVVIRGGNCFLHFADACVRVLNIAEDFGSTGSVQFGIKKNALLDEREVVNVLASQRGESSSGYSVFIGREESGKEGEFLRQNPECNRWP